MNMIFLLITIIISDNVVIYKYLTNSRYKIMVKFIKQIFIALLSFSASLVTKCKFLNNESCLVGPTLIDLVPNQLHYYTFMFSLDRSNGNCDTLDDPSGKICVLNKKEDVNLNVFNDNKNN